jgi:hypothetical protein
MTVNTSRRLPKLIKRVCGVSLVVLLLIFVIWNESSKARVYPTALYGTKELLKTEEANGLKEDGYSSPFLPLQVLRKYKQQHSQEALMREHIDRTPTSHRKYAVAYYWCPQRAGNILHSFFNTIVWSMIHNRTVLWIYHNTSNTEADCQGVLKRAPWLPSYYEWRDILQFRNDPVAVPNKASQWEDDQTHQIVLYPQIPDVLAHDSRISRNSWSDHPLEREDYRAYIQELPETYKNTTTLLYSEGVEFLYGMLYSDLFSLEHPAKMTLFGQDDMDDEDGSLSLALHSRHPVGADDGSYIQYEQQCLQKLLPSESSCRVHLMSDRPKTIELLTEWLLQRNCSVVMANHDDGSDPVKEHGPWAGAGYLQDLEVSGNARHGVIGDKHRSSTALLIDLIEYRRRIAVCEATGDWNNISDLRFCQLPNKHLSGYNYGPGTPTFRHHTYLQPLQPVRVVEDYVERYVDPSSEDALEKGRCVIAFFDFDRPTPAGVYSVLNSKYCSCSLDGPALQIHELTDYFLYLDSSSFHLRARFQSQANFTGRLWWPM